MRSASVVKPAMSEKKIVNVFTSPASRASDTSATPGTRRTSATALATASRTGGSVADRPCTTAVSTTDCGPDDVYRIRAYETTYTIPRFNNADGQVTILVLHNRGSETVSGNLWFWSPAGALLANSGFTVAPQGGLVFDTTTLPGASSASGSITVSNDGAYGIVEGKAVALEPGTGFTSDTPMVARTP